MESLELRIFREVAQESSISKAAENLNYVQSNITAHIKRLEEELGTILFIRHGKGVTITADGEKLLNYANSILELIDRIWISNRKFKIKSWRNTDTCRFPVAGLDFKLSESISTCIVFHHY